MVRVGIGIDAHKFASGRKLILGGVTIEHPVGLDRHSDADVLSHAIADALLGAVAKGDIGGDETILPNHAALTNTRCTANVTEMPDLATDANISAVVNDSRFVKKIVFHGDSGAILARTQGL